MRDLTGKSEFTAPRGSASQPSAASSGFIIQTVHIEPFQDTSRPESTYDPSDISHLDTHTPTTRSRAVSVTSSLADSNLQFALAEFQREITELKDIVVKKFSDDKPDNPRLGFCDFLKVKVVQLTSDSYDKFQQETFNLLMRLRRTDKQQQRYQHGIGTNVAQSITYSQALMSHHYPVSHTQMQAPHEQMHQTFTHYRKDFHSSSYSIPSSTFNGHLLSHMHQLDTISTDSLHSKVCSHNNTYECSSSR